MELWQHHTSQRHHAWQAQSTAKLEADCLSGKAQYDWMDISMQFAITARTAALNGNPLQSMLWSCQHDINVLQTSCFRICASDGMKHCLHWHKQTPSLTRAIFKIMCGVHQINNLKPRDLFSSKQPIMLKQFHCSILSTKPSMPFASWANNGYSTACRQPAKHHWARFNCWASAVCTPMCSNKQPSKLRAALELRGQLQAACKPNRTQTQSA